LETSKKRDYNVQAYENITLSIGYITNYTALTSDFNGEEG